MPETATAEVKPAAAPPAPAAQATLPAEPAAQNGAAPPQNGNGATPPQNGAPQSAPMLTDDGDGEDTQAQPAKVWPDDWREQIAGKDDKLLSRLKRYASPLTFAQAGLSAQDKIRTGEFKAQLPQDATPEQVAEWRKQNGLPEEPNGYKVPAVVGHEWTEADKPILESFFQEAHKGNLDQSKVDVALNWYVKFQQEAAEKRYGTDMENKQAAEDALRIEWGTQYRPNLKMVGRYLEQDIPDGLGRELMHARMPDGSRLIDKPGIVRWFAELARQSYGDTAFVSGDSAAAISNTKHQGSICPGDAISHPL